MRELFGSKNDVTNLKALLKEDLVDFKAEMIKWMFIFWISQIGVIGGIMFAMLKLYFK